MTNFASLPNAGQAPGIKVRTIEEYVDQEFPERHDYIGHEIMPRGGKLIIGALKGKGKTVMMVQMMCELGSASPFLGLFSVPEPRRCLLFQKEVDDELLGERLKQTMARYQRLDPKNILIPNRDDIVDIQLDTGKGIQLLFSMIRYYRPDVVFLDPIVWFHHLDEDKVGDVKKLLDILNQANAEFGCVFVISHHFKKPYIDQRGKTFDQGPEAFRGSGLWYDWCDTGIWMNDRGGDKRLLNMFTRHGRDEAPTLVLTLNRKYAVFDAEIQGVPTTAGEYAAMQVLAKSQGYQLLYSDLVYKLQQVKIGPRQAQIVINALASKRNVYFVGNNGDRVVRMLSPQAKSWVR